MLPPGNGRDGGSHSGNGNLTLAFLARRTTDADAGAATLVVASLAQRPLTGHPAYPGLTASAAGTGRGRGRTGSAPQ